MDIKIRHLDKTDMPAIRDIYRHTSVVENTSQTPYINPEFIDAICGQERCYNLVAEVDESKVLGHVSIMTSNKMRVKHAATLMIAVHPDAHGKGIGKALLAEMLNQTDNWLNLVRVELEVHKDNETAIALYQKLGFEIEGEKRLSVFKDGKLSNLLLMARIRPDFKQ